jgi:hypothetical protein
MTVACSICASTDGPFAQEPTGVATSPHFVKCQTCTQKYAGISFKGTVGSSATLDSVKGSFYPCSGCENLYYKAIPYAFLNFDVRQCPSCDHPFPTEESIEYPQSSKAYKVALKGSAFNRTAEELDAIYEKLVTIQPKLSKAVENIMLVESPQGRDIWAVLAGDDSRVQEALQWILMKAADRKLTFSGSQRYDFAVKGVTIHKQIAG